jgi:hypothetical protein
VSKKSPSWLIYITLALGLLASASACSFQSPNAGLIRVPIRWCIVEGSKFAEDKLPGQDASSAPLFTTLNYVNGVWQQANILFFPAENARIPVIADPDPRFGPRGSIDVSYMNPEPKEAADECRDVWQMLYPQDNGLILVATQSLLRGGEFAGDLAATPAPPRTLWVKSQLPGTGARSDDLCGWPRHLTKADSETTDWSVLSDLIINLPGDYKVAHELGHQLMLPHGNGLDDNHDGFLPPQQGPRRFDEYCDPDGMMAPDYTRVTEDLLTPAQGCATTSSLMGRNAACSALQPLQVELARDVARLVPGAIPPTPISSTPLASSQ